MKAFKTKKYYLEDLKNESVMPTILGILKHNIKTIMVHDLKLGDSYKIILSNSNTFQIEGLCYFNGRPSFQADFKHVCKGNDKTLVSVINAIAGGEIIKENGCLVDL